MMTGFEIAKQTTCWSTAHTVQCCECHIKHTFNQLGWRGNGGSTCSASLFSSWSTQGLHPELQYKTEATTIRSYGRWGPLLHQLKNPFTSKRILNEGEICKQEHAEAQARCTGERGTGKEQKHSLMGPPRIIRHSFGEEFVTAKKVETRRRGQLRILSWAWETELKECLVSQGKTRGKEKIGYERV